MKRLGLILALILAVTLVTLAQSSTRPSAKYGGTRGNPRLIELSNEITLIGFVVREAKDQRTMSMRAICSSSRLMSSSNFRCTTVPIYGPRFTPFIISC